MVRQRKRRMTEYMCSERGPTEVSMILGSRPQGPTEMGKHLVCTNPGIPKGIKFINDHRIEL